MLEIALVCVEELLDMLGGRLTFLCIHARIMNFSALALIGLQNTIIPSGRKDVDGKVISTRLDSDKNAYIIEYTITSSGVQRHLLTVFSLQPGRYVLTLTGQAREDNWAAREPVMRAVTDSFILNKFD